MIIYSGNVFMHLGTHTHVTTIKEKESMKLRESKWGGYLRGARERERKG